MLRTTLASSRCIASLRFRPGHGYHRGPFHDRYRRSAPSPGHRHWHARHQAHESYSPAFSSIIVDANSGATLTANNPDASRHPASLTKIMTLYLLFERLEAGKMKLDTELEVSEHASEPAADQARPAPGSDHQRRGRDQGTGHALRQRRCRRDRGSHRRRRRRFRQADDAQGARARHEPDDLSQCLRPAQQRTGDHRARSGDARPRASRNAFRAIIATSRPRASSIAARRSAITTTCSAASRASTASRPATPAPRASIS